MSAGLITLGLTVFFTILSLNSVFKIGWYAGRYAMLEILADAYKTGDPATIVNALEELQTQKPPGWFNPWKLIRDHRARKNATTESPSTGRPSAD